MQKGNGAIKLIEILASNLQHDLDRVAQRKVERDGFTEDRGPVFRHSRIYQPAVASVVVGSLDFRFKRAAGGARVCL